MSGYKVSRSCPICRVVITAPVSRIRHVLTQHVERCAQATPADRRTFARTRKWPK
jgi:hypothetical protein